VSKDKKKNNDHADKKNDHKDKKHGKKGNGSALAKAPKKAAKSLQSLTQNPLVADVVAAALVSMAAALKDSDKARRLANDAGDQLSDLSKTGAKHSGAMWDLALDVGRRTLEALAGEQSASGKRGRK
jgi:prophage DNA circulation protein